MQSNVQPWQAMCAGNGIRGRRPADHQAGGAQRTTPVSALDRFVDLGREPKIVAIDHETMQHGSIQAGLSEQAHQIAFRSFVGTRSE